MLVCVSGFSVYALEVLLSSSSADAPVSLAALYLYDSRRLFAGAPVVSRCAPSSSDGVASSSDGNASSTSVRLRSVSTLTFVPSA